MATEATFTVDTEEFPLGAVFEEHPEATVELERVVPGIDVTAPYVWIRGADAECIEDVCSAHPDVRDVRPVDVVDDHFLLRVEWEPSRRGVLGALAEARLPLLEALGTNEGWRFRVRGDERDDVAAFYDRCRECEIPITMTGIGPVRPMHRPAAAVLTKAQRNALMLAHRRGYFTTPRSVTMDELGAELGISQQAVGSRIRRGLNALLDDTLMPTEDETGPDP